MVAFKGTSGPDTFDGTSGSDMMSGLAGNDILNGGDGVDSITGGTGYDQVTGGAGADIFAFYVGDGGSFPHDVITDFQVGVDRLSFQAGVALHTEDDPAGQWVHYGSNLGNNDWIQLNGVHGATIAQLTTSMAPPPPNGPTPGDDTLTGTPGADVMTGLGGNDLLVGEDGADTLTGGTGVDLAVGGTGADVFVFNYGDGGAFSHDGIADFQVGVDKLVFPTGAALHTEDSDAGQWVHYGANLGNNDWVLLQGVHGATLAQLTDAAPPPPSGPTVGNDTLNGTSGPDAINALAGNDVVNGGDGADTISGSFGYDQMTGGAGADVFAFSYNDGGSFPHDVITDFQLGVDKLLFPTGVLLQTEADAGGQWVHYGADLGTNDWVQLKGVHGATIAQLTGAASPASPTPGNDTLVGTSGADAINALAVNDVIGGEGVADTLTGGAGNDRMDGGTGDDHLWGDTAGAGAPGGADTFVFSFAFGRDKVHDFRPGEDKLEFFCTGADGIEDLTFHLDVKPWGEMNRVIEVAEGQTVMLMGYAGPITAADVVFT